MEMSEKASPNKISEGTNHKARKNCCEKCKRRFSSSSKLKRHELSHSDKKQIQCHQCHKQFKLQSSLQRHQRHYHEKLKQHKCDICNASFAQRINLQVHQQRLHSLRTNLKCTACDSYFKSLNSLNRHLKTHPKSDAQSLGLDDDPNSLAKLVVTQLKCLEEGISSAQIVSTPTPDNELEATDETTFVEQAKFGETNLEVKLNPEKIVTTIKVQTVKRPHENWAYVCEFCAKEFRKTYNFIRHIRTHTKERPYNCTFCSSNFLTKSQLEAHVKRMHILDDKTGFLDHQHKCFICSQNFSSMRKLDLHMKSHAEHYCVQYFCSDCNHKFSSKTAFSAHKHKTEDKELEMLERLLPEPTALKVAMKTLNVKSVHEVFTCSICSLQQRTLQDLYRHRKQHDIGKKYKCKTCGSSFISNLSLRTHQKLHNKEMGFPCTICLKRKFPSKSQLQRHVRHAHGDEKNFQCQYCKKRFKTGTHCKRHMKTHIEKLLGHSQPNSQKENSPTAAQLVIHEKNAVNNSAKFIQIEMLPKNPKFKHRNIQVELAVNSNSSTNSPKYNCSYCDKGFQKPSDMARHTRLHTQERPFNCDICNKSFKLKSTLDDHHKTHLSNVERSKLSVACQVCGKSYASQKSLNVHLRLHTGKCPFQCESCGKKFRTSGHRLAHLKATKSKDGKCRNENSIL